MKRTSILVALALCIAIPASGAQTENIEPTNWVTVFSTDTFTSQKNGSARLIGIDGLSRLSLVCNGITEPVLSLQFRTSAFLGSTGKPVLVRIDNGQVLPLTDWSYNDKVAYTSDEAWVGRFLEMIKVGEHRIVLRALDYADQPHDGVFISRGAVAAITEVVEACEPAKAP